MQKVIKFDNPYRLSNILKKDAQYNVIIGQRSNGKTYAPLEYALEKYFQTGEQFALIRRWDYEFTGGKGSQLVFRMLEHNAYGKNRIRELSKDKFVGVEYWAGRYWLCQIEAKEGKRVRTDKVIGYGMCLNHEQAYKEGEYPLVSNIIFDEFITRDSYLTDEFVLFANLISTIKRERQNIKVFLIGNTISKFCPYFAEMGLHHIKQMHRGDLDVYKYGDSGLTVAVEFSDAPSKSKAVDPFFAFNNPKLKMITTGEWEMSIYPHLPHRYKPIDVLLHFFINFNDEMLHGEVIMDSGGAFLYIHRKTSEIRHPDTDLLFSTVESPARNVIYNILRSRIPAVQKIVELFRLHKAFYQDNEVGEIVRSWLELSRGQNAQI